MPVSTPVDAPNASARPELPAGPELHDLECAGPAGPHRLAWVQWGQPDAPRVVVCVHGLARQARDFDVLARALVAAAGGQLRVVCPDMPGRGRSQWLADPKHYVIPTYTADMLALLGELHRRAPITRLDWVGTSMGGLIGLSLFGTPDLPVPAPLGRMVINDIGPVVEWAAIERIGSYVGRPVRFASEQEAAQALLVVSASFGPHTPEQWMALTRPMLRPAAGGGFELHYDPAIGVPFRAATQDDYRQAEPLWWQAYDRIQAPTLLLRGRDSDLLSAATAQAMTARGPRARLVEFSGVGHAPTLVADDQVQVVREFLLGP
jgi:pimeloyl-ACP methyl ester carboxylesterase